MPAESQAQQMMAGADLARLRRGEKTRTGMSESQLRDFAKGKRKGKPYHKRKSRKHRRRKRR